MTREDAVRRYGHAPSLAEILEQARDYGACEAWCEPRDWAPFVLVRFEIYEELLGRTRGAWLAVIAPEAA